ncbi:MAG: L-2-amino-thiazoline-4-carboxylic acid hydrolase [Spirochaetaceae bacterium]|jgi:hypothetical protein|nr:L-2-amino-thiazoline-4-carboxylic acid hydrolase [Spirochaetaceae bacterium]
MSKIQNNPSDLSPAAQKKRAPLEHRALWMYLLCDEAAKKGFPPEQFAPEAIRRCGLFHGGNAVKKGNSRSLKSLKKIQFTPDVQKIFEMQFRRCTDDNFDVNFHYCPLVNAWQKAGCTDEEIATFCDFAMWGDRGIAEEYGCELELPKTIARGDDCCEIRFIRRNKVEKRK